MNLRALEYFVAVAEGGNVTAAARALHVTQSTLSIQLQKLEAELRTLLFERQHKKLILTHAGHALLPLAQQAVQHARAMKQLAATLHDPLSGRCRFGVFPTLAPYLLPHIMPGIHAALPKLHVELHEEKTADLLHKLDTHALDAALVALPVEHVGMRAIRLFTEPFYLATPVSLKIRAPMTMESIPNFPLLLLDEGHCLRAQALEVCSRIGRAESGAFRATSLETLRQMVAGGAGMTFIPALAVPAKQAGGVRYVSFSAHAPMREVGLVYRASDPRVTLMHALADAIREALRYDKRLRLSPSR
jgi:LysR family hydrogen peroxide-inducible transcriptional activator